MVRDGPINDVAAKFIDELATVLRSRRFRFASEADLQAGIAETLTGVGFEFKREHRLSAGDRLDFYLGMRVAIEVKIDGSLSELTRQIHRYAQHEDVDGIVVVTSRSRHTDLPPVINHKPVRVVHLLGSAL